METLVPDTSVLIDGRITDLFRSEHAGAHVLVPRAVLAELEAQANRGLETGFAGLSELQDLQQLAREEQCTVDFDGERPTSADIERASDGAIDALIRDSAIQNDALFVTSDRVQAYAAAAAGIRHHYVRPLVDDPDMEQLQIWGYFEPDIMSVHLKADCKPMVKRGTPAGVSYEEQGGAETSHTTIRNIAKECVEFAKRDYNSFIEMERHGCTVCQLGPMRITIAQPPFSDALEITAVRPVFKAHIDDYDLPEEILGRMEGKSRGVFVAGPPGSGKSTFAAAVAEHLHEMDRVVKTMEAPRDLQVPKEITQYAPLDKDMAWTGEIMLLVRPDHVVYDEVRTTSDFQTFADMRLAGIGLFGVTHANRAIDAVQRLIGRVDLGMIPQIVDTVVYIDGGRVADILELRFTVKVPHGIESEDLARPVVEVLDVPTGRVLFELYSFGEQIVVMPLDSVNETPAASPAQVAVLKRTLGRYVKGNMEVELRGRKATVYVAPYEVPALIGKGGRTVQALENRLGVRLDIRAKDPSEMEAVAPPSRDYAMERGDGSVVPVAIKQTGNNVFVVLPSQAGGQTYRVQAGDEVIAEGRASQQGKIRFKKTSPEAKAVVSADRAGMDLRCYRA